MVGCAVLAAAQSRGIQECVIHLCWLRTTAAGREGRIPLHLSPGMENIKNCSPLSAEVLQVERGPVPSYNISLNANSSSSTFSFLKKPFTNPVAFFQPGPYPGVSQVL